VNSEKPGKRVYICLMKIQLPPIPHKAGDYTDKLENLKRIIMKSLERDMIHDDSNEMVMSVKDDGILVGYCNNNEFQQSLDHAISIQREFQKHYTGDVGKSKFRLITGLCLGNVRIGGKKGEFAHITGPAVTTVEMVADCGEPGHILSTSGYREMFLDSSEYLELFHYSGKYRGDPGYTLNIYNIFRENEFGNEKNPVRNLVLDDMSRGTFELKILKYPNRNDLFDFQSGGKDASAPSERLKVNENTQSKIREALDDAGQNLTNSKIHSKFKKLGRLMFIMMLPDKFQSFLKKLKQPISIATNDPSFPWELLHDGEDFLCLKNSTGRKLISEFTRRRKSSPVKRKPSALFVACESPDLENVDKEMNELHELMKDYFTVEFITGKKATLIHVLEVLANNEFDIIHFSGHARVDEDKQEGKFLLSDGYLYATEFMRCIQGSPLIFLNACLTSGEVHRKAGIVDKNEEGVFRDSPNSNLNFFAALVLGNPGGAARAFIGSQWKVDDESARDFSISFYRHIIQGNEIGEALRLARIESKEKYKHLPTWAAYVLYGDPCFRIFRARKKEGKKKPLKTPEKDKHHVEDVKSSEIKSSQEEGLVIDSLDKSGSMVLFEGLKVMQRLKSSSFSTPFLMIGLLKAENGITRKFIESNHSNPEDIITKLSELMAGNDKILSLQIGVTKRVLDILKLAGEFSRLDKENKKGLIGEEHILQGFMENGGGITGEELKKHGVRYPTTRDKILSLPLFNPPGEEKKPSPVKTTRRFREAGEIEDFWETADTNQKGKETDDYVFSGFFPGKMKPREDGYIIAYVHLEELAGEVVREASGLLRDFDIAASPEDSAVQIEKGSVVSVTPDIPGLIFENKKSSMRISRGINKAIFHFNIDNEFNGRVCDGSLLFWIKEILIASLPVTILIVRDDTSTEIHRELEHVKAKPYRTIFASYSHRDIHIVERVRDFVSTLGDKYLMDVDLRSGQDWNEELMGFIRNADVFQLFWSKNSASSRFVEQEWRFALKERKRKRDPKFIRPVFWEDKPSGVPPELEKTHFTRIPVSLIDRDSVSSLDGKLMKVLDELGLTPGQISDPIRGDLLNSIDIISKRDNRFLTTSDIFLRFMDNKSGETWDLLGYFEILTKYEKIRRAIKEKTSLITAPEGETSELPVSRRLKKIFRISAESALSNPDHKIEEKDVLKAMLKDAVESDGRSTIFMILKKFGFDLHLAAKRLGIEGGSAPEIFDHLGLSNKIICEEGMKGVELAGQNALSRQNKFMTTCDLLIGLLKMGEVTTSIFNRFSVDINKLEIFLNNALSHIEPPPGEGLKISNRVSSGIIPRAKFMGQREKVLIDEKILLKSIVMEAIEDPDCMVANVFDGLRIDPKMILRLLAE